jgi:hypothetical protein
MLVVVVERVLMSQTCDVSAFQPQWLDLATAGAYY